MTIKEISDITEISPHTIRFYEKKGIINQRLIHRLPNNYREYDNEIIEVLKAVKFGKQIGFTLAEIGIMINQISMTEISNTKKIEILQEKLKELDEKKRGIDEMRTMIRTKISKLENRK